MAAATEASISAALHLADEDAGAVEALRTLARRIDEVGERFDNVTLPTYLKFCESLGLTPAGRKSLGDKREAPGGKLAQLRSVARA